MTYQYVRRHFNRSAVFFLLTFFTASLHAQVNLTVNTNQTIRTVDERVFGANSVIWDGEADNDQTISLLQTAGLRCVRVPGGSLSDEYHWRTNTARDYTWTWATAFDGFSKIVAGLNSQTFVTVNYGSGTAQEAAALVAYANAAPGSAIAIGTDSKGYNWQNSGTWASLRASTPPGGADDGMNFLRTGRTPLGLKYWEIGNECYGSWEYDLQAIAHDPTTYANRAGDYITAMKAVDPTIKIGVVVVTSGENGNYKNWTPVMLARLKVLGVTPDFVIYHSYPQAPGSESDATLLQQAATWATSAADIRQQLTTYLGTAGSGVEIVVTENNSVYSDPGKQSTSLVNGLYLADSIANVMKTEINAFMWWAVRNGTPTDPNTHAIIGNFSSALYGWRTYGDYGMISTPVSAPTTGGATTYWDLHPTYYAMKLLSKFARGGDTVVQAASNNALLSVFAVRRTSGALCLLVINKDPSATLAANIAIAGFNPAANATIYSYGKTQDTAAQTGSGTRDIATSTLSVSGSNFSGSFAPYSATVLSLDPAPTMVAPSITTQPVSQEVSAGDGVTFVAVVSGLPAPTYQWKKNGVSILGATASSYTIVSAVAGDAASYSLVATNSSGSVTSNVATLIVNSVPIIDSAPMSEWVAPARNSAFTLMISGTPAPSGYQWQRKAAGGSTWVDVTNAGAYSGATTATLLISNATTGMNGDQFRCVVTNAMGSTTSSAATLTVATPATWAREVVLMNRTNVASTVSLGDLDPAWRLSGSGDFNGDGKADILLQNVVTGQHSIWVMNGTAHSSTVDLGTTDPTWQMAGTGDFNHDGKPDILWQNTATGQHSIWLMNGTTNIGNIELPTTDPIWRMTGTGDFNQDGQTDILWQNIITGQHSIWLMSGTTNIGNTELGTTDPTWLICGTGDFNGDGQTDILWQNTITGQMSLWLMNGTTVIGGSDFGTADPSWQAAGVGDFDNDGKVDVLRQKKIDVRNDLNGDGFTDILWQNTVTGQHSIWLMNGTTYLGGYELGTTDIAWQIAGTGDFNADGQTDILWHNLATGQHSLWLMHGTTYTGGVELETTDPVWQIGGTGEFNGDGQTDILFQNVVTGEHSIWLMNGTTHTGTVSLLTTDPAWQMVGSGDFNADGHTDILWQNIVTGEHSLWLMTGSVHTGTVDLGTTSPLWQMAGTGDFNADGSIDILWQNTATGQHSIWLMHGTTNVGNIELGTTDPVWVIVN